MLYVTLQVRLRAVVFGMLCDLAAEQHPRQSLQFGIASHLQSKDILPKKLHEVKYDRSIYIVKSPYFSQFVLICPPLSHTAEESYLYPALDYNCIV